MNEEESIDEKSYSMSWASIFLRGQTSKVVWLAAEVHHGDQACAVLFAGWALGLTPHQAISLLRWDPELRKVTIPEWAIFREADGSWTLAEEISPGGSERLGIHVQEAGSIGQAKEPDPWESFPGSNLSVRRMNDRAHIDRLSQVAEDLREIRKTERPPEWTPEQAMEAIHLFPQGSKPPETVGERFEALDDIRERVRDQIRKLGHPFAVIVAQFGTGTLPALDRPSDPTESDLMRIGWTVNDWTQELDQLERGEKVSVHDWKIWISGTAVWTSRGSGDSERAQIVEGLGHGIEPRARLLGAHRMVLDQRRQKVKA